MSWALLARVLDGMRIPVSVVAACAFAFAMTLGPFSWLGQIRPFAFAVWFAIAFVAGVIALTALLALAEHYADRARAAIHVPSAIATYRSSARETP